MLLTLLQFFATKFLFLALHLESGCFPRPLTAREEAAAFSALRAGDAAAREKLIRHNLRLVAHIVKKYYALPGDQEDLVSIGTIGLMKAVDTFDATRKARFSTYASRCIENEIRMQFRRERKSGQTVSLQEALEADGDSALTLADVIQDGFCMEDSCERQEDVRRLRQLLDTLPARERQILLLRYGLAGQPPPAAAAAGHSACPGAADLTAAVRAGRAAAPDPAGDRRAAGHQPQLRFPAGDPRAGAAAAGVGQKQLGFTPAKFSTAIRPVVQKYIAG